MLLPPNNALCPSSFFLTYQKGKSTIQKIEMNKFGQMGRQVAMYLNLPNPGMYTGHTFRMSSKKMNL